MMEGNSNNRMGVSSSSPSPSFPRFFPPGPRPPPPSAPRFPAKKGKKKLSISEQKTPAEGLSNYLPLLHPSCWTWTPWTSFPASRSYLYLPKKKKVGKKKRRQKKNKKKKRKKKIPAAVNEPHTAKDAADTDGSRASHHFTQFRAREITFDRRKGREKEKVITGHKKKKMSSTNYNSPPSAGLRPLLVDIVPDQTCVSL
jgi:hypothetical protein